jgi:hypothetical protein
MMLFLGAGASKPVGIPTMKEMSEEFENTTDLTKDERELYLDIKNTVYSDNLEDILTVLNDLTKIEDIEKDHIVQNTSIKYFKFKLDSHFNKFNKIILELKNLFEIFQQKKIAILGVGGAGCNVVNQLYDAKTENAEIIAINTDSQHLDIIKADKKILIGKSLTKGLSAGGSPEIGKKAAELSRKELNKSLKDKEAVFIIAGMGGGTGTGASSVIADIAKKEGAFVTGLAIVPFEMEKGRSIEAEKGIKELRKWADIVQIFDNKVLLNYVPDLPIKDAFVVMGQLIGGAIRGVFSSISKSLDTTKKQYSTEKIGEVLKNITMEDKYLSSNYNFSWELKSKILAFIKGNCVLKEESRKDALKTYNQLFETLRYPIFHEIFTTNYDLVIDKYIESTKQPYYDGFNSGIWDPKGYEQNIEFKIFKLHGAIDQYVTEKGRIVKVGVLDARRTVDGEKLEEAIIYPMREKEVYKDPFFELFTRLKTSLLSEKICVVIGYSFGDEHIRNIFFDAVKRNPEIRIFTIHPQAKKIRNDLEHIKDKINPIEGKFGEESVFEELEERLNELD